MQILPKILIAGALALGHGGLLAQEAQCPNGRNGDWVWEADADKVSLYYTGGMWNLLTEDAPPAAANPTVIAFKFGKGADGTAYAVYENSADPQGATARDNDGKMKPLFDMLSHRYAVGLAMLGGDIEISGERNHNGQSLNLFGRISRITEAKDRARIEAMFSSGEDIGVIVMRPEPIYVETASNEHPVAFALVPGTSRAATLTAARRAQAGLAGAKCRTRYTTNSFDSGK